MLFEHVVYTIVTDWLLLNMLLAAERFEIHVQSFGESFKNIVLTRGEKLFSSMGRPIVGRQVSNVTTFNFDSNK